MSTEAIKEIDAQIMFLKQRRDRLVRTINPTGPCIGCSFRSNPAIGIPVCRDAHSAHYAKQVSTITWCRRFPNVGKQEASE